MDNVTRRRAIKLTAVGAAALAAGTAEAQGQPPHVQEQTKKAVQQHHATGSSRNGSFDEALKDAVGKAHAVARGPGRQVRWTLKEVTGVNGGTDPLNTLTVTIHYTLA